MGSLPEQHIDSLPTAAREHAYQQIGMLCAYRSTGLPEDEVAAKAKFGSVDDMYFRLKRWGLYGLLPSGGASETAVRERKARSVEGAALELPPVTNAATHLRDTIRSLDVYLEEATSLKETLKGRYFMGEGIQDEDFALEARGMQWHPHRYLVVLIALSILQDASWGHVERLLKDLHPNATKANRQQLVRFIYGKKVDAQGRLKRNAKGQPEDAGDGLLDRANQIAALVRGSAEIKRGVKPPAIDSGSHLVALYIRHLADKGASREEIARLECKEFEDYKKDNLRSLEKEREDAYAAGEQKTVEEIDREIQRCVEDEYDADEFDRRWRLAQDFG